MTQEEYNQLDADFAHCAGTRYEQAGECLRRVAHTMLVGNEYETYTVIKTAVITEAHSSVRSSSPTERSA